MGNKILKMSFFVFGLFFLISSCLESSPLELVKCWERVVNTPNGRRFTDYTRFLFPEFVDSTGKILLATSKYSLRSGSILPDSSTFAIAEIDIHGEDGDTIHASSVSFQYHLKPGCIKKYNDTLEFYMHFKGYGNNFRMYKAKVLLSAKSPTVFIKNPDYYCGVIDTSVKGLLNVYPMYYLGGMIGMSEMLFHYNRDCGLIYFDVDMTMNGDYKAVKLSTTDTLVADTINKGNLLDGLGIEIEGEDDDNYIGVLSPHKIELDSNNYLIVARIVEQNDVKMQVFKTHGLLIARFDAEGNLLSKKVSYEKDNGFKKALIRYNHIRYANNKIFVLGSNSTTDFLRVYNLDGDVLKENNLVYIKKRTEILSKYTSTKSHLAHTIKINERDELYIYGANDIDGSTRYCNYIAKYSAEGKLLYEYEWKTKNSHHSGIEDIISAGDYLYAVSSSNSVDNNYAFTVHKWLEQASDIKEPSCLDVSSSITIYPNPASDKSFISLDISESCELKITLCDILGREILDVHNGFVDSGNFTKSINTSNLSKGVYFLKISIGKDYKVEKFVVE